MTCFHLWAVHPATKILTCLLCHTQRDVRVRVVEREEPLPGKEKERE